MSAGRAALAASWRCDRRRRPRRGCAAPGSCGNLGLELLRPELQRRQGAQFAGVVRRARDMVVEQLAYRVGLEQLGAERVRCEQQFGQPGLARPAKPLADGNGEHLLFAVREVGADEGLDRALEPVLFVAVLQLGVAGRAEGELHQAPIEQGRARLQRHRHTHAVGLHQVVAGQQQHHVQKQHLVDAVEVRGLLEPGRGHVAHAVHIGQLGAQPGLEQRGAGLRAEQAGVLHIVLGEVGRGQVAQRGGGHEAGVFVVAGEQLVAAVAGEHDFHILNGELADAARGHERGVAVRLVAVPQHAGPVVEHVGLHDALAVRGAEALRSLAGVGRFVEARIGKADAKSARRFAHMPRHERHDGAGIDPAREKGAEGHVGAQSQAHRVVEQVEKLFLPGGEGLSDRRLLRQAPPAAGVAAGAIDSEHRAGQDVAHAREQGEGRRNVVVGKVVLQRGQIERGTAWQRGEHGLDLGAEQYLPAVVVHEQRLDADAVAHQMQPGIFWIAPIPDSDGEHAVEPRQEAQPFAFIQPQQHFGIAVIGVEAHAPALRLSAQFHMVENLAVLHQGDSPVVADEGLVTTGEVDDGEPSVANRHARSAKCAAVIRAAMDEAGVHRGEGLLAQLAAGTVEKSINSTHGGIVAL